MSMQREIKLLCLHEIGWCRLIQLEFGKAMNHFDELKYVIILSKHFPVLSVYTVKFYDLIIIYFLNDTTLFPQN